MAVDCASPVLAIRSSVGIEIWASSGPKQPYEYQANLPREETKNSRSITFSPNGCYFAYSNGQEVKVLQTTDWGLQCTLPRPKAFYLKFSPRGTYLCTWELYTTTKDKPDGSPNMFIYEIASGNEVFSIIQKQQTNWEPSWSIDESILALVVGGEALFYDLNDGVAGFENTSRKVGHSRGGVLSLGPGSSPPFLGLYTPGTKGGPSMCKLYKYPALAQNQTVACKSFFQADRVEILWNKRGTGLLLLTSTEVDQSGASYYGNQALHFMSTKGDSCSVPLSKDGPVHCVKWSPKATEFLVVYGFMPSRAALYNLKCDVIFNFSEGPRNCAYFNPFGNLVVLAGFGNLPGNVEIWDVSKKEKLADIKCPDTTHFEWNPNGEYFVTATTAPRLRIGNGFKVYHYSGALLHETMWPQGQELLAVEWQQFPENTFEEPKITKAKHEGIKSSQIEASKKAYTPPHLRLMQEGKNPEKYLPQPKATIPGMPAGNNTKGAQKSNNRRNRQNRKDSNNISTVVDGDGSAVAGVAATSNKQQQQQSNGGAKGTDENQQPQQQQQRNRRNPNSTPKKQQKQQPQQQQQQRPQRQQQQNQQHLQISSQTQQQQQQQQNEIIDVPTATQNLNGMVNNNQQQQPQQQQQQQQSNKKVVNPEKEKKIRNVAKKLSDIKKLKARQELGEVLELNQVNKISMEAKFLEELRLLKLT